ncbi:carbohydrate binding domain-containing protein [Enterovirga rhinocerotis]|uniref:CBM-cenC domain-containing protein n=1 Tax=Enterovirga rhinocerotis TaxID=1339210 RepID=A0A4R7C8B5_9HYPH|nr:carbohydrate binding domain-containing protein [Enterovirga rhinocerotis]TDR94212.1 hypothetical protein EV668_1492 [Enterovirga rhinocerotis]
MPYIAPSGATLTLAANATSGTIAGTVGGGVQIGMALAPGIRGGIGRYGTRTITTWTGTEFTVNEPFTDASGNPVALSAVPFTIDDMAASISPSAQNSLSLSILLNEQRKVFGSSITLDGKSKILPRDRGEGAATFFRDVWQLSGRNWFALEQKTVAGAGERLLLQAFPDGVIPVEAIDIAGDGTIDFLEGEGSLASSATTNIGGQRTRRLAISGTATIASFGSGRNKGRILRFLGAATIRHNATSLVIPGAADIVMAAGDILHVASDASGNWRVLGGTKGNGQPMFGGAATESADGLMTAAALKRLNGLANGPNLVPNGGFEQGLSGWPTFAGFSDGATQQVLTSIDSLSGGSRLRLSFGAKTTGTLNAIGERIPVVPGAKYAIGSWLKSNVAAAASNVVSVRAQWFKSDGTPSATAFANSNFSTATTWTRAEVVVVAPADAGYCEFRLVINVTVAQPLGITWIDFDECSMTPVASIAAASLPSFTVATLPTANLQAGDTAWASNCRAFNGAGTQEGAGAGTGAVVTWNGSVWKIAGTNVTAIA